MSLLALSRIGFEPMTQEFSALCSNLLSYLDIFTVNILQKPGKIGFEPMMNFFITIFKIDTLNHSVTYLLLE